MSRVAIIAAMAGELKPLVRGWEHRPRDGVGIWRRRLGGDEWVAAFAGVGVDAATRSFAGIERDGPVDLAVSVGWAGALREGFATGRAYRVSAVIDALTGERFRAAAWPGDCLLVTARGVADPPQKRRLAAAFGAGLVDMEAAAVARLAAVRGIPFHCVKGVTDAPGDQLPDFNRFISADGQFQAARFALSAILRPRHWRALLRMGENSRASAEAIRESLLDILDDRRGPGSK
jgi:adenosylhomocysteine nucleosidase